MPKSSDKGNKHGFLTVLVVRFSAIGDVAMTVPVLYSVCRRYPDIRFVMVTRPSMTSIFINKPSNLVMIPADTKTDYAGPGGIARLVSELCTEYRPDALADLHSVLRTRLIALLCRLRGIRVSTIDKGRGGRRALTRGRNKVLLPLKSGTERYREVFKELGLPFEDCFEGLYGGHAKAPAEDFARITAPRSDDRLWIGIAPFAAHKGKIYPIEKMEQVVKLLSESAHRPHIFLFGGGEAEEAILQQWAARYPGVESLAGKRYGFRAELALMNHLDVMLSMDSANMHLASIAGTRTITIWGATHPYCGFQGWRQSEDDFVQLPVDCRPCSIFGNRPCRRGDYICLNAIAPRSVAAMIIPDLRQNTDSRPDNF